MPDSAEPRTSRILALYSFQNIKIRCFKKNREMTCGLLYNYDI